MIIEQRTYTLHPGKMAEYQRIYEAEGVELQKRILGRLVGYFTSESGVLNQLIHMWAYDDMMDRHTRRAALQAEPQWQGYLAKVLPLIQIQHSQILTPTKFSPLR